MKMDKPSLHSLKPYALSILRIGVGYLFTPIGTNALFGLPPNAAGRTTPAHFGSMVWYGGVFETIGGALLILGLLTVPVAFILCGEMAVAYFTAHAPTGSVLVPFRTGGSAAALLCFVYLYLFAAGSGHWSLDAAIAKLRGKRTASPVKA